MTKYVLQNVTPTIREKFFACQNQAGNNPLSIAVLKNYLRCAEHLLQYGAELKDLNESAKAQLLQQREVPKWRNMLSCYSAMINRHATTPRLTELAADAAYQTVSAHKEDIQQQSLPNELKILCQHSPMQRDLQQRYVKSEPEKEYMASLDIQPVSLNDKALKEWLQSAQGSSRTAGKRKR